jgi:subtilase family serine protease
MMRVRLLAGIAVIGALSLAATEWGRSLLAAQGPAELRPRLIRSERHDRSPALRTMRRVLPPAGPVRLIPNHSRPTRRGNARRSADAPDPVLQTFAGSPLIPAPSESFDGVGNTSGVLPPDPNGDVGPSHYFQTVNLSLAIYSKGNETTPPALVYGPFAGTTLWAGFGGPCETYNHGDPIVMYDHLADRWFMSQLAIPNMFLGIVIGPFYQCVAVSATPDPTGAYYRYQFEFDKLNDYPKFGVWSDAYYMAINQFEDITLQWAGQGVLAIDRARMLAGEPASMVHFDLASTDIHLGGMLPADLDGMAPPPGSPGYFVQLDDDAWGYSPDQLQLWRFHVNWATPSASSFTGPTTVATAPFDSDLCGNEPCVPQPDTTARLDAISDRLMYRLQYRNFGSHESLVVNHTVDTNGQDHAGIRWYEVRNPRTAPVIHQQGTYAPDADHRTVGSAAMDRIGNLAVGFTATGPTTYPSMRYAGRLADDPPGLLAQGEADLVTGHGSQTHTSGRWGDYSSLVVDPSDGCTFWYTSQYYSATSEAGWRTRIGSFAYPSCTSATGLPAVTVTATTPNVTEAQPAAGRFTFTRTGQTTSALTVRYTVGGTAAAGGDYVALPDSVTIPEGALDATLDITPLDDSFVEGKETVVLTLDANEFYFVSAPAGGIVNIASDDIPSDLVVSALTPPAGGGAGASIVITDTTRNQGTGMADESSTAFYLSTNTTFDTSDVLIGARPVPALAPGASDTASSTVAIPAGTAPGTFYIVAKADGNNAVFETQEGNNTRSAMIRIGADLVVSAVAAPATAAPGSAISVSETTTNNGGGGAISSVTNFYLSANTTFDANDTLLGSRPVGPLAANASDSGTSSLTIPGNTPGGAYYIIARADANGTVAETIEGNNTRASAQVRIGADLTVTGLTAPATANAGASIGVTETTRNQGAAAAPTSHTGFYLSTNSTFDAADALLGTRIVSPLDPSAADTAASTVTIPAGTASGTYYLIARADVNAAVVEGNETNNTASASVRIGPDLTVSALTVPATGAPGSNIAVSDTTRNDGGGLSISSLTRFYLSANSTLDASDVSLGARPVPQLLGGASDTGPSVLLIPATTPGGTYYVIAKADGDSVVAETTESNNTRSVTIKIGADLTVSVAQPAVTGAGMTVVVTDTTRNQGAAAADSTSTIFYLSTNATLDPVDVMLGTRPVPALDPNASHSASTPLQIPASTPTASYYVIGKADAAGAVAETNENNNTSYATLRVGPDLIVSSMSGPSSAVSGSTITVTDTTRNQGGGSATGSTTRFYWSSNLSYDASDTLLAARTVAGLDASGSDVESTVLTIPAGLPTASFYVIAVADGDSQVVETLETNNTRYVLVRVTAAPSQTQP